MTEKVQPGTLVMYHGSMKNYHGLAFVAPHRVSGHTVDRYSLVPFAFIEAEGERGEDTVAPVNNGHLYDVRRQSFTVIEIPEKLYQPKPGIYHDSNYPKVYKWDGATWFYWSVEDTWEESGNDDTFFRALTFQHDL